jgi:hypothetical protein
MKLFFMQDRVLIFTGLEFRHYPRASTAFQ